MGGQLVEMWWRFVHRLKDLFSCFNFLCCVKDLGVTKVGHMKRILQGIRELNRNSSASEA